MNMTLTQQNPTGVLQQRWRTRFLWFAAMCLSTAVSAQLNVAVSSVNPSCAGYTNGAATATISGGTAPYTYQWVNGNASANITGLAAGSYGVTVTDASNHTVTGVATLTNPAVLNANVTFADICNVGNVTGVVTGGTAPYTYSWSNGASGATIHPSLGNLTLTATDANGCNATKWVNVPNFLAVTLNVTGLRCYGDCDAAVEARQTGGTAPFTYLWTTGATTQILAGVPAGNYGVTVTDANGCKDVASTTIYNPTLINISTTSTNASCGSNNGVATVNASGGVAPLTYAWSNGATTASITGLGVGTYTVTITDRNLCRKDATVQIISTNGFDVTATATEATCGGTNGSVNAIPNGGTSPFQYLWSTGATTQQVAGLNAGDYRVTVTAANGCAGVGTTSVTASGSLTLRIDKTDAACGITNGTATARVTGGTAPYTYLWSNGRTTQTIDMLHPTSYRVTVTDASGCSASRTIVINQTLFFLAEVEGRDTRCYRTTDGEATAMGMGGTPPYTYTWSNGANTQQLRNLSAGLYTVTLHDQSGCSATESIEIHEPDAIYILLRPTAATCGERNGSIQTTVTGGTIPYTYAWNNSATTQNLNNLVGGNYAVTVTDDNGCYADSHVTVGGSTPMELDFEAFGVSCHGGNDGEAEVHVAGGTAPFTYLWSNGATTLDLTDLEAGTYSVTVTDAIGCTKRGHITIYEPEHALTATVQTTNASCGLNNGSVTVTATGGTTPYVYTWNNSSTDATISGLDAGTYIVTVRDDNFCTTVATGTVNRVGSAVQLTLAGTDLNCYRSGDGAVRATITGGTAPYTYAWSNNATTQNITGLQAGTYTLTVTDANGCTGEASATITEPGALYLVVNPTGTTCGLDNGGIRTTVAGGTTPYAYLWSNGATTADISSLAAGTYHVTVTDAHGCSTNTFTTVAPSTGTSVTFTQTNVTCFGLANGSATATATGIAPYTYAWSNNATTQSITGLQAGAYTVTVTGANGCTATATVTITQPAALYVVVIPKGTTCGLDNGGIRTTVSGGTAPYRYLWSNGATVANIGPLAAGMYRVTVTDANGCFTNTAAVVDPSTAPSIAMTQTNVSCFGLTDGSATATVTNGLAPYTYAWSNGATTNVLTNVGAGGYTLTVTDLLLCTAEASVTITEPALLVTTITPTHATCGLANGSAASATTGGTTPYTYLWSNGATTANLTGLTGGTFTLTVTDAHRCTATRTVTINNTPPITNVSVTPTNVKCYGGNDGAATVSATGGTAPITYSWSNNATGASITGLVSGNYSVTATDAVGCTRIQTFVITQPTLLVVTAVEVQKATCLPIGKATATATGGTAPYRYTWDDINSTTGPNLQGVAGGTYTVTVLDANNCRATVSVVVGANTSPNLACTVTLTQPISDGGGTDGKATVTVTGHNGTLTYRWSNGQTTATATGLGALRYWVTITDGYSCETRCEITLLNPPCDNVTDPGRIGTANATYCPGGAIDPITSVAPATGGTGTLQYVWMYSRFNIPFSPNTWEMVPGQNGTDLSGAAIQALNLTGETFFIRCVRRNGCSFKESNQVSKTPKIVGEAVIPDPICVGRTVTFEAPNNGTGGGIYSWNFGPNATPSTSSSRVQNVTFTVAGRQNVQLAINKNACLSVRSYPVTAVSCAGSGTDVGSLKVAAVNHHEIALTWVTRDESETSVYTVERSSDGGKTFETVHNMASKAAAAINNYNWNDNAPKMGRSAYRIKRVGFSGKMNYTHPASILMAEGDAKLLAYPNPTGDLLFVETFDNLSDGTLEIYNETGALVHTQDFKANDTRYSVDMTAFGKGLYLVRTRFSTGETNVVRITKF
jgi:hypothetical protein